MDRDEDRRQWGETKNTRPTEQTSLSTEQQLLIIEQAMSLAVQHHGAGRLPEAERIYRQILQADPGQPVANHMLGVIAIQMGNHDVAVDLITKTLALQPENAQAHNNLAESR